MDKQKGIGDIIRQGDVALIRVEALPADAKKVQRGGTVVLAHGEVTGHAHTITGRGVALYELPRTGERYLTADQLLSLAHQEHSTLAVEPGVYRVVRQREWTDEDEPRIVGD